MKRLSFATGLLAALAVILAALGVLCGTVADVAGDETLYAAQSRAAVAREMGFSSEEEITAYIGLNEEEQQQAAVQIALYMAFAGEDETLDLPVLNEREQQHMRDVRGLIRLAQNGYKLFIPLAAALAVVIAWTGARLARRHRTALLGAISGLCALLLAALGLFAALNAGGFERLFVGMHELLFANDLWLMNPQTDVLIRMMPQTLFESALGALLAQAAKAFGFALVLLTAVYAEIAGIIGRHLSKREKA